MPSISRLKTALHRQGIHVERANGVFQLHNKQAHASVLLPDTLPLEEKAVKQLLDFASVRSADGSKHVCKACATPDFHPGTVAPVGSIVATPADFVIPAAVGTDVNCSVRLMTTGLTLDQLSPRKDELISRLTRVLLLNGRDVPIRTSAFAALFDSGPEQFLQELHREGLWAGVDRPQLQRELAQCVSLDAFAGAARHAPEHMVSGRDVIRDPGVGTLGGSNHFFSLEIVDEVLDRHAAFAAGLKKGDVVVMIHTGSRDIGFYVGRRWMDRARDAWPVGLRHPQSGLYGLTGPDAAEYLEAMGTASRYAWLNRTVLGEMFRKEAREMFGDIDSRLVVDVPHNVVLQENGLNIHRKGATPARDGQLALIPGSMGDASYLVTGMGNPDWLWSCSHGAGRSIRRQAVRRVKGPVEATSWQCVTLKEERRIEEAPHAYKPIGPVIEAQESAGLIRAAVRLKPWVTFKA